MQQRPESSQPGPGEPHEGAEHERNLDDHEHHRDDADDLVPEGGGGVRVRDTGASLGRRAALVAHLERATLHRVGSFEPDPVEDRGRDVDDLHESGAARRPRAE